MNLFLAEAAAGAAEVNATGQMIYMLVSMGVLVVVFYFFLIRPQKKKEKEQKAMKESIQIGDEVVTIGGITGIVVRINKSQQNPHDDSLVIETGGDRNKVRVMLWAISENKTIHDEPEEAVKKK